MATKLYNILSTIHHSVYSRFKYVSDIKLWNKREHWEKYNEIPTEGIIEGDCDCFALACRRECRKLNIPSRLVYCTVLRSGKERGHLVLESGGWILDNNHNQVMSNNQLDYTWKKISGFEIGDPWHNIETIKE